MGCCADDDDDDGIAHQDFEPGWRSADFSACSRYMPEGQADSQHWNSSVKSAIMKAEQFTAL
jgi:hypothetical protein